MKNFFKFAVLAVFSLSAVALFADEVEEESKDKQEVAVEVQKGSEKKKCPRSSVQEEEAPKGK